MTFTISSPFYSLGVTHSVASHAVKHELKNVGSIHLDYVYEIAFAFL